MDFILVLLFLGAAVYAGYRIKSGINYKWNWALIPQYLFRIDPDSGIIVPNMLMKGLFATIKISLWSSLIALLIGIAAGLMRRAKGLYPRLLSGAYVELIRNTPPLVLVFIFYFFIGSQITTFLQLDRLIYSGSDTTKRILAFLFAPKEQFTQFFSAVLTMALYEGAYMTEIIRAGFQSVEKGQYEASYSLGFSAWSKYRYIILPQALKTILPALAGQFISTIKDSAIVSVISIQELTFQGMELMSSTYLTFEVWITITLLYFFLTFSCSMIAGKLEKGR